jgi:hypothetical protein
MKEMMSMSKKSKLDEIATLIGLVFILIAFLIFINSSNFSVNSIPFHILISTAVAILFPLIRSVRINALAYGLVTYFILAIVVGTASLPQLMIVLFVPVSLFFFAGIIEVKGYFLKGLILAWWGFVFYDLYNLGILNGDFFRYIGERQFQYASEHYLLIVVYAILFKLFVHMTLKPVYISPIFQERPEKMINNDYLIPRKVKRIQQLDLDDTPSEYYSAHIVVKDLYDRGVISKSKLKYYANLNENDMLKQLSENQLISEEENTKLIDNNKENDKKSLPSSKDFTEEVEINYVDDSLENTLHDSFERNEENEHKEKKCLLCHQYPCACCQNCYTSPCSCCTICGHPKRWCSCF